MSGRGLPTKAWLELLFLRARRVNRNLDATHDPLALPPEEGQAELVSASDGMPAVLIGQVTPLVAKKVEEFCRSVAQMLEAWIQRNSSANTQRTYRRSVMAFVEFLGIDWERNSHEFLSATVADVRTWRDELLAEGKAGATVNARLSAVSGFYRYMREVSVTEFRLPIQIPNPAHAQHIGRERAEPVTPTHYLTLTKAKKLLGLPSKEHWLRRDAALAKRYKKKPVDLEQDLEVLVARDRALIATFLYTGIRIGTACRLDVADFHNDEDDPTLSIQEKGRGRARRLVGVHYVLAELLRDYLEHSNLSSGPLFRARANSKNIKLSNGRIDESTVYDLLLGYLGRVPGAMVEERTEEEGVVRKRCRYSPHSLRATTATLLDEVGVSITKIQELLGHSDIRVTQRYIKLLRDTKKSASRDVPL